MDIFWFMCILLPPLAAIAYEDRRRYMKVADQMLHAAIEKQEQYELELSELQLAVEQDASVRRQEKIDLTNAEGVKDILLKQILEKNKELVEYDMEIQKLTTTEALAISELAQLQRKVKAVNELNSVLKQRVSNINDEMNGVASRMPTTTKEQLDILTKECIRNDYRS